MIRTSVIALVVAATLAASPALAGAVSDAVVDRKDAATLTVRWIGTDPVDVYVAERPDATAETATLVSRGDTDGRHEFAAPGVTRRYFLLRDTRYGTMVRVAERLVPLAQGSNFRDLGGYPAAGGKHVRWGLIYRSGATPMLTDADVARVKALGIHDIVDLRSSEERLLAPTRLTGIRYTAIDYSMMSMTGPRSSALPSNGPAVYRNFPAFFAPQIRVVFDDLLRKQGALVYHCSAGQDRTGFTTAMVLSALGVPRDTITADYHLSTTYRQPQFEMPKIDAAASEANPVAAMFAGYQKNGAFTKPQPLKTATGEAYLDAAFAEITARWGSVDGYLEREVGVSKADIARLRALYLE